MNFDPTRVREEWVSFLVKVIETPLQRAAAGDLREALPHHRAARQVSFPLECMARILTGIAPWLFVDTRDAEERQLQAKFKLMVQQALESGTDPERAEFWGFGRDKQSLVDTAFLASAFLRSPGLLDLCSDSVRRNLLTAFISTRKVLPYRSNWLLFSAMVEAGIEVLGGEADLMRVDYALMQHEAWYTGDGWYCDGPDFHLDYYNSLVIHPLKRQLLDYFAGREKHWDGLKLKFLPRQQRLAQQLERMIAADGSWPPLGRSLAYRCGVFHALADLAGRGELGDSLSPGAVRSALTASLRKSLGGSENFSSEGWLKIGLSGDQPGLGEAYISVASCYLCSAIFLPLGLPAEANFWSAPAEPWTQVRLWERKEDMPADKALGW
jgi:hypothetical protein